MNFFYGFIPFFVNAIHGIEQSEIFLRGATALCPLFYMTLNPPKYLKEGDLFIQVEEA